MLKHVKHSGKWLISHKDWTAHFTFALGGVVIGLVATFMAISSEWANHVFHSLTTYSPYLPFIVSPLGLMLVVWLTRKYFPGSEGSGIPQVMATLEMGHEKERSILLTLRIAFGKVMLCILGLLSGASIGREGPTVHVGAAIMFSLRKFVRFRIYDMERVLILAGGGAGVAAAFNTPLAGIVFAIEELSRSFEVRTRGLLLTAIMVSAITAIAIAGNYTYFGSTSAVIALQDAIIPVIVCGVICGFLGGIFSLMLIHGSRWIAPYRNNKPFIIAALCGLSIAIIGYYSGHMSYGSGYDEAKALLTASEELDNNYGYLKLLATVVSYLSGIPGGIFAPSLATGAGLGAHIADWLTVYPYGALVLFGMVGYFAGVVQAPITAFVIVMEMTDQHQLILPMMVTAFIATGISKSICTTPIYSTLADNFLPDDKKMFAK
ncbi:MAG: chloride channel protein [Gammaproteobacteria bacterium]|nr:chloride channel protein [Gammaproteobacteria bacterium]